MNVGSAVVTDGSMTSPVSAPVSLREAGMTALAPAAAESVSVATGAGSSIDAGAASDGVISSKAGVGRDWLSERSGSERSITIV